MRGSESPSQNSSEGARAECVKAGWDLEDDFDKGNVFISVAATLPGRHGGGKAQMLGVPILCLHGEWPPAVCAWGLSRTRAMWFIFHISISQRCQESAVCQALSSGQRSTKRYRCSERS